MPLLIRCADLSVCSSVSACHVDAAQVDTDTLQNSSSLRYIQFKSMFYYSRALSTTHLTPDCEYVRVVCACWSMIDVDHRSANGLWLLNTMAGRVRHAGKKIFSNSHTRHVFSSLSRLVINTTSRWCPLHNNIDNNLIHFFFLSLSRLLCVRTTPHILIGICCTQCHMHCMHGRLRTLVPWSQQTTKMLHYL